MKADLRERLEAGETGREIDMDLFELFGMPMPDKFATLDLPAYAWEAADNQGRYVMTGVGINHPLFNIGYSCPAYSTSLDAAISLVERVRPGAHISLEMERFSDGYNTDAEIYGAVHSPDDGKSWKAHCHTPAAALIAALLKAGEGE